MQNKYMLMLKLYGWAILLAIVFLTSSGLGYAQIDSKNIIGLWHFDENKGEKSKDESGKDREATLANGTDWGLGKFGSALKLDGQDDIVRMPANGIPDEFTLSVWINPATDKKAPGDDGDYGKTILSSSNVPGHYGFWLLVYQGKKIRFYAFEISFDVKASLLTESNPITLNKWHHVATTAVKGKKSVIYVNGKKEAERQNSGSDVCSTTYFIGDLRINRGIAFDGLIDEVAIFDKALSETDIAKIADGRLKQILAVDALGKLSTSWGGIKTILMKQTQ